MHHFDEVSCARRTAVNISVFGCTARHLFASGSAWNIAAARRQSFENRIQLLHGLFGPADHHAIAALQSPDPTAGAHVYVMDALVFELLGAADVVLEVRVSAIDQNVASLKFLR